MVEYREQARKHHEKEGVTEAIIAADSTLPGVADSTHVIQQLWASAYTSLAETYGLDDMYFSTPDSVEEQLPEQEYQAYVTAPLSLVGADTLRFWEVCDLWW